MSNTDIGELFGVQVRVSKYVPDGEVYVMNKKMLDSFTVKIHLTKWQKIKRYFCNLWYALKGQSL